jgi:pyridoxal/pyridoxine/pyridoxamine kinase
MGDNGKLYIPEDEVPEYKGLLREADLILPNQFEAELVHHAYKTLGILTEITDYSLTLQSPT